jgi:hypothetical protein
MRLKSWVGAEKNMKENEKLLEYHLGMSDEKTNADFMREVERLKKLGRRLSNNEKALLLRKARPMVYSK